jgi:uncharacterized protein (DUF433 family)
MDELLKRITSNPKMCGGRPCIRNMRFRVIDMLDYLAAGESRQSMLEHFDFLEDEDISAALMFAERAIHNLRSIDLPEDVN